MFYVNMMRFDIFVLSLLATNPVFTFAVQDLALYASNGCHNTICSVPFQIRVRRIRVLSYSLSHLVILLVYSLIVAFHSVIYSFLLNEVRMLPSALQEEQM